MNELFAWIDVETTGLSPEKHRVIEIAIEVTDQNLEVKESYESKIALDVRDRVLAEPKALEINGYTEEEWEGAPEGDEKFWKNVNSLLSKKTLAGQNIIAFDSHFVACEMLRHKMKPAWSRRQFDVMTFSIYTMTSLDVKSAQGYSTASLPDVYRALGGPDLPEHRAMADVKRAQWVYRVYLDKLRKYDEMKKEYANGAGIEKIAAILTR